MFSSKYATPINPQSYYKGKVCTLLVSPTALPTEHYSKEQAMLQFSGIVTNIEKEGIGISNLLYNTRSYFFHPHIIGICEEQVLDENDPQVEIIEKAQEKKVVPMPAEPPVKENAFIDIQKLQNLAAYSRDQYNKSVNPMK